MVRRTVPIPESSKAFSTTGASLLGRARKDSSRNAGLEAVHSRSAMTLAKSNIRPGLWLRALQAFAFQAIAIGLLAAAALGATAALFLSTDIGQLALSHFSLRHPEAAELLRRAVSTARGELQAFQDLTVPIAEACWAATKETSEAFVAWGRVVVLVGGPLLRVLCYILARAGPVAASILAWAVRFQLSLPSPLLLAEGAFIALAAFSYWFKHFLARKRYIPRLQRHIELQRRRLQAAYSAYEARWVAFKAEVAAKSRLAAAMLPHMIYASVVTLLMVFCPLLTATVAYQVRSTLVYSIPLVMSIWTLVEHSGSTNGHALRHRLMYWTVYAAFSAGRDFWAALPVVSRAAAWVPRPEEVTFFTVLWMLMPFGGLETIFKATVLSLRSYVGATPQFQSGTNAVARARSTISTTVSQLASLRIISEQTARLFVENVIDGASLAAGLIFLFTPSFVTRIGVVYIGYFVPINATLRSLSSEGAKTSQELWLKYWVVQVPYSLLFHELYSSIRWVPLLPIDQANLLFLLWLQLPYFRGTETVCRLMAHEVAVLIHVATEMPSPKAPPSNQIPAQDCQVEATINPAEDKEETFKSMSKRNNNVTEEEPAVGASIDTKKDQ